jgi:hypothetical protein
MTRKDDDKLMRSGKDGKEPKRSKPKGRNPKPVGSDFRLLVVCFFGTLGLISLIVASAVAGVALDWIPEPVAHVMLESVARPLAYGVIVFLSIVLSPRIARAIRIVRGKDISEPSEFQSRPRL